MYHVRLAAFLILQGILDNYSQFPVFYLFKPCRRQAKQPQFDKVLITSKYILGRAKRLGLLGQSLLNKLAIIYAVVILLVICIIYVI